MKSRHDVFKFIQASLNLFKAVPDLEITRHLDYTLNNMKNLANGFFILGKTFRSCPYVADEKILSFLKENFGHDIFEFDLESYESFKMVDGVTPQQILANRILQYLSGYGMTELENFERNNLVIPNKDLSLPEHVQTVKISIIGTIDKDEIEDLAIEMIENSNELSDEIINDLIEVMNYLDIEFDVDDVPNQKLLLRLCDMMKVLPKNPAQFLRYMIYRGTGSTLLIKNNETIENIKNSNFRFDDYFMEYIQENGIAKLASVFHRFKPLWLAFKPHSDYLKTTINKIRKLAARYHKPAKFQPLENLTYEENINLRQLKTELSKVKIEKKISLANALLYRKAAPKNIIYEIRNGKNFVADYSGKLHEDSEIILQTIIDSIVEDIKPKVEGKKIYIPENFNYAMPVNEKKFIGNIPYGSCYTFKSKSCAVGVHWFNLVEVADEIRIDLDLHLNGSGIDITWSNDSTNENTINTKESRVIFSGDMTDAPVSDSGATEAFFIGELLTDKILMLNLKHYNHKLLSLYQKGKNNSVPFKLVLANVDQETIDRKYLINSYENAFCMPFQIDSSGMFLGFIKSDKDGNKKFYFCSRNMGNQIAAPNAPMTIKFNSAMSTSFESRLSLNEILEKADAIFENVDKSNFDINLDPFVVTKETFMELLSK